MAIYQVKSHAVEVSQIVSVQPLVAQGKILSPDAGLVLVLDDDTKHKWISGRDGETPSVGDVLVRDTELNVTYIVGALKFKVLFEEPRS